MLLDRERLENLVVYEDEMDTEKKSVQIWESIKDQITENSNEEDDDRLLAESGFIAACLEEIAENDTGWTLYEDWKQTGYEHNAEDWMI